MIARTVFVTLGILSAMGLITVPAPGLDLEGDYRGTNVHLELPGLIGPMEIERAPGPDGPWTLIESRPIGCTEYCEYEDWEIQPGTVLYYRIWVPHETGSKDLYGPIRVVIPDLDSQGLASVAFPNPFYGRMTLRFSLPSLAGAASDVRIDFVDARGRLVRTFRDDARPGSHIIAWDGRSGNGESLPTGIYFYRISVPGYAESGRLLLLK
jgi:hypothetical protein